jgi:hypothetical protein
MGEVIGAFLRREGIDEATDCGSQAVDGALVAFRSCALSLAKAFSIGLKSGL